MTRSAAAAPAKPVPRGGSRFRLRVVLIDRGPRPYGWEIYDDDDGKRVCRSKRRFRTPAEAWEAGSVIVDE